MATLSAAASGAKSGVLPRQIHAGVNAVYSEYTITATLSNGDIIDIAFIPDGARVIQVMVSNSGDMWDGKINIGTGADHDLIMQSQTFQQRTVLSTAGVGTVLDVSDAATTRYTTLKAKMSDTTTASGSNAGTLKFYVLYHMDQATS